jgi:hypothetical protein
VEEAEEEGFRHREVVFRHPMAVVCWHPMEAEAAAEEGEEEEEEGEEGEVDGAAAEAEGAGAAARPPTTRCGSTPTATPATPAWSKPCSWWGCTS